MTDTASWAAALQWTVWAIVMSLVMGWLARSRHRKRPASARCARLVRELSSAVASSSAV